jgi:hypothetical protein
MEMQNKDKKLTQDTNKQHMTKEMSRSYGCMHSIIEGCTRASLMHEWRTIATCI